MSAGACPTCGTPYTPSEVVGLGILRARPAAEGGPLVEYRCGGCLRILTLVPHGAGRYAPPGVEPPEPVPPEERLPPWVREGRSAGVGAAPPPPAPAAGAGAATGSPSSPEPGLLRGVLEAYELLGVPVTATREEVERAFRGRSLTCHPDKVAHLDEDFRELAERKFKRLVEAYRTLNEILPA